MKLLNLSDCGIRAPTLKLQRQRAEAHYGCELRITCYSFQALRAEFFVWIFTTATEVAAYYMLVPDGT